MKSKGKIIGIILLLVIGMSIAPTTASTIEEKQITDTITLEFIDSTGKIPIKTTITLPQAEWDSIKNEIAEAKNTAQTPEESIYAELEVLQNHGLITTDIDALKIKITARQNLLQQKYNNNLPKNDFLNNSIISAMCAINFELSNGTTLVLGLNSFVNYIGFDIISFHKGYAPSGIQANGLLTKQVPAGEYAGFCFGFLGYWFGEKTSTGIYSSVTCAGFTVITAWFPVPELP